MQPKPIRIVIVDDHPAFSHGLKLWIEKYTTASVMGVFKSGILFLESLKKLKPDYVFMDIQMPGLNGIETTKKTKEIDPKCRIIAMTMFDDTNTVKKMLDLKVSGFITKDIEPEELGSAINKIFSGECYITDSAARNYALQNMLNGKEKKEDEKKEEVPGILKYGLSHQEIKIIKLIALGNADKKISEKLHISIRTVGWHKSNLMKKISAKKSTEIVAFAYKWGLI